MNMIEAYEHLHDIKWHDTARSVRACWADAWNAAVENEREECAKECEALYPYNRHELHGMSVQAAKFCAAKIRSRSNAELRGDGPASPARRPA